jgi:2-polyprenyl-3-methyl-5-hydroxy-6-metoxy-1,4-benzoquinol methylase
MRRVERILALVKGPDVLDVGCAGETLEPGKRDWLHGRLREEPFLTVRGIDSDTDRIAQMRALGFENVQVADAQSFDLPDRFDTVTAGELIEHLEAPASFLRCAAQHLKPNGRLILTTPYPFALVHVAIAIFRFPALPWNSEHTLWLCPTTIRELARRADLRVTHVELVDDYYPWSRAWRVVGITMRSIGRILPKRLRYNSMVIVLEAFNEKV